ncbi:MAG: Ribokinase, partial [Betaproteobacteria bacterium]|nr:Ribokinase [Betaproteobacteria bacterium]
SRRSLGRVSVPVWLVVLSNQLQIVGLVSFYLTNNLI